MLNGRCSGVIRCWQEPYYCCHEHRLPIYPSSCLPSHASLDVTLFYERSCTCIHKDGVHGACMSSLFSLSLQVCARHGMLSLWMVAMVDPRITKFICSCVRKYTCALYSAYFSLLNNPLHGFPSALLHPQVSCTNSAHFNNLYSCSCSQGSHGAMLSPGVVLLDLFRG